MTIKEAVELADRLSPNQYPISMKIHWLSKLDGRTYRELIATHANPAIDSFDGYVPDSGQDTELLIEEPYDEDVYNYYLQAKIALENGEISKYNTMIIMYNTAFLAYSGYYNRTHMPLPSGQHFRF